jgi:flagellar hook protein FlgE
MSRHMSVTSTIAVSGLNAASQRMQVAARNIAAASLPAPGAAGPDLSSQIVDFLAARIDFSANAAVIRADAQMTGSLLNILA